MTSGRLIVGVAVALLVLGLGTRSRADIFTYDLIVNDGVSTFSMGDLTISGNTGDSFTLDQNFDNVTDLNLSFNGAPFGEYYWNFSTLVEVNGAVDFSGGLGDSVLSAASGEIDLYSGQFLPEPFAPVLFLGDSSVPDPNSWVTGLFPVTAQDGGDQWSLTLAPTASVPLPSSLAMGLIGTALLAAYSLRRRKAT
jgi:hypothetical protein